MIEMNNIEIFTTKNMMLQKMRMIITRGSRTKVGWEPAAGNWPKVEDQDQNATLAFVVGRPKKSRTIRYV